MAMAQEEPRQKSLVDRANSAYSTVQNARKIAQTAKKIQAAASVVATAVSTSEIWVPALVIGIIILLIIVFFIVITGQNNTNGVNAQPGPAPTSQNPSEVVYCQGREAWSSQPYDSGTVGGTGCVPTSMSMILSSYGGTTYTPGQVATMMHNNGWDDLPGNKGCTNTNGDKVDCRGTNPWKISGTWLDNVGFKRAQGDIVNNSSDVFLNTNQLQQIKNYADSGWLMLSAANGVNLPTPVNGGHEVVIETADPQANTITIRDPNSPNCRSGKTVTFSASNVGWWLITPIKIK